MFKSSVIILVCLIPLMGCSPKIDTSSDQAMKKSIAEVRKSLPEDEQAKFDDALKTITLSNLDLKSLFAGKAAGIDDLEAKIKASLNGKTGAEVIAEAQKIEKERKEREKGQALSEIKELEQEKANAEKARHELAKFRVLRSRFYKERQEFMGSQPVIELTVLNGTSSAISRAYFKGTLASPNRAVPWMQDDFNYQIPGGLEPGEKATWRLAPNMFSDWGRVNAPKDAILTVEVEQLDGPGGKELFSVRNFTSDDAERLSKLKKEYGLFAKPNQ